MRGRCCGGRESVTERSAAGSSSFTPHWSRGGTGRSLSLLYTVLTWQRHCPLCTSPAPAADPLLHSGAFVPGDTRQQPTTDFCLQIITTMKVVCQEVPAPEHPGTYDYVFVWDEDLGVDNFTAEPYLRHREKARAGSQSRGSTRPRGRLKCSTSLPGNKAFPLSEMKKVLTVVMDLLAATMVR